MTVRRFRRHPVLLETADLLRSIRFRVQENYFACLPRVVTSPGNFKEDCMPSEVGSEIDRENEKVVSLIMGGDRKAVDLLFASHIPQLRRTAAWMLANSDDSEDALQDGLLLAYRNLNQFQGRAKFSTWLHRIRNQRRTRENTQAEIKTDNFDRAGTYWRGCFVHCRPARSIPNQTRKRNT